MQAGTVRRRTLTGLLLAIIGLVLVSIGVIIVSRQERGESRRWEGVARDLEPDRKLDRILQERRREGAK